MTVLRTVFLPLLPFCVYSLITNSLSFISSYSLKIATLKSFLQNPTSQVTFFFFFFTLPSQMDNWVSQSPEIATTAQGAVGCARTGLQPQNPLTLGREEPAPSSQHIRTNLSPTVRTRTYCVSLERFDRAVTAESADVDTHVCATRSKGSVVLPIHVKGGGCGAANGRGGGNICI